jgi:hypothetical protein
MREAGAPSTWGGVVGCPVRRVPGALGKAWSHRLRSRATWRGRKVKAALWRMGKKQRGQHYKHYKAGARKP